jgi:hypothetical protein
VFKGSVSCKLATGATNSFKLKIVLQMNFPFKPPRVYIDENMHTEVVRSKNYIGTANEITIAYLTGWNIS